MSASIDEKSALALAEKAAEVGAKILMEYAVAVDGMRVAVETKGTSVDLVTEIDRESERAILAVLATSGIAIVAEEGGRIDAVKYADAVWFVDPLDGTTNYVHGHPFFCVSIGLVVSGEPRLGVVHAPMLGVVWTGGPALGACRRDLVRHHERSISVSSVDRLQDALVATGFPYDRWNTDDDNLDAHRAILKRVQEVRRCGSAAIDLALVADGTYEAYWERKLQPWDIAAGVAIVRGANGQVTDPWLRPLDVMSGAVLASNAHVHQALGAVLTPHLPSLPPTP